MRDQLRTFITTEIMHDPDYPLEDDEALISSSLIDSMSLVYVQLFIEEQFSIRIADTDMTIETADNINDIVALIEVSR
jgi:acyl carrier protein